MQVLPPPSDMAVSAMAQQLTGPAGKFTAKSHHHQGRQQLQQANPGLSYEDVLNEDFQFNMDAHDVMVFLHIQKTGGTSFGKHLVRDLDLKVSDILTVLNVYMYYIMALPYFSDHANANANANAAIASERIATRTGCSRAIRPAGNAVCTPTGRS